MNTKMLPLAAVALLGSAVVSAEPVSFTQDYQGVTFAVNSDNASSINTVTLTANTEATELLSTQIEADGTITGIEVDDLDANGYPEIYIYVTSAGSGSYGSLIAYASNRNLSLTPIYLPPLTQQPDWVTGYRGHDEFAVGEGALLHRFPLYREDDTNAAPTGGHRQIQYHLEAGEAGWTLSAYRVTEF